MSNPVGPNGVRSASPQPHQVAPSDPSQPSSNVSGNLLAPNEEMMSYKAPEALRGLTWDLPIDDDDPGDMAPQSQPDRKDAIDLRPGGLRDGDFLSASDGKSSAHNVRLDHQLHRNKSRRPGVSSGPASDSKSAKLKVNARLLDQKATVAGSISAQERAECLQPSAHLHDYIAVNGVHYEAFKTFLDESHNEEPLAFHRAYHDFLSNYRTGNAGSAAEALRLMVPKEQGVQVNVSYEMSKWAAETLVALNPSDGGAHAPPIDIAVLKRNLADTYREVMHLLESTPLRSFKAQNNIR